jgi:hypothetical protein
MTYSSPLLQEIAVVQSERQIATAQLSFAGRELFFPLREVRQRRQERRVTNAIKLN